VADVARAHGINHNVVFGWRRLAQRGLLRTESTESTPLLPVRVESPTLLPSSKLALSSTEAVGSIEIEFPGGVRVRVQGNADAIVLERVFKALARR
jgi:transposase-like protein